MSAAEHNVGVASPRESVSGAERAALLRAFARFDPIALGVATGSVAGLGLFALTAVLLLRGGSLVGFHLKRVGYFLPGYDVSWGGAVVGLLEAGVLGFLLGAAIAVLWNVYHRLFIAVVVARERTREIRRELQEL